MNFINALPLYAGLEEGAIPHNFDLIKGNPSDLNQMFSDGDLDISLVSGIEYLRNQDCYNLLPGLCISGKEEVRTVYLYVRKGNLSSLDGAQIGVTTQSSSSVQLLRLLCGWKWKVNCEMVPASSFEELQTFSAFLVIGDDALCHPDVPGFEPIDLAQAWFEATGFPMVFGVLAVQPEVMEREGDAVADCYRAFTEAREWGLSNIDRLAEIGSQRTGLTADLFYDYFSALSYCMDDPQWKSLGLFGELSGYPLKPSKGVCLK